MTNAVEWISLGLGIFSAIGVGYLVYQSLFDFFPSLSYSLRILPVSPSGRGTLEGAMARVVATTVEVWNNTSRDAVLHCGLMVPILRSSTKSSYRALMDLKMRDEKTLAEVDMRQFTITARNGRRFTLQGDVMQGTPDPRVLEFTIGDDRVGRREWKTKKDLSVGSFPEWPPEFPPKPK